MFKFVEFQNGLYYYDPATAKLDSPSARVKANHASLTARVKVVPDSDTPLPDRVTAGCDSPTARVKAVYDFYTNSPALRSAFTGVPHVAPPVPFGTTIDSLACECPSVHHAGEYDYTTVCIQHTIDLLNPMTHNAFVPTATALRKRSILPMFLFAFTLTTMLSLSFRFCTVLSLSAKSTTTLLHQTTAMANLTEFGSGATRVLVPLGSTSLCPCFPPASIPPSVLLLLGLSDSHMMNLLPILRCLLRFPMTVVPTFLMLYASRLQRKERLPPATQTHTKRISQGRKERTLHPLPPTWFCLRSVLDFVLKVFSKPIPVARSRAMRNTRIPTNP